MDRLDKKEKLGDSLFSKNDFDHDTIHTKTCYLLTVKFPQFRPFIDLLPDIPKNKETPKTGNM